MTFAFSGIPGLAVPGGLVPGSPGPPPAVVPLALTASVTPAAFYITATVATAVLTAGDQRTGGPQ